MTAENQTAPDADTNSDNLADSGVDDRRLVLKSAFFESSCSHERADSLFRFLIEQGFSATVKQDGRLFVIKGEKIDFENTKDRRRDSV